MSSVVIIILLLLLLRKIGIINTMHMTHPRCHHARQLQLNLTHWLNVIHAPKRSRHLFQAGHTLDAKVGKFVNGALTAVAMYVKDVRGEGKTFHGEGITTVEFIVFFEEVSFDSQRLQDNTLVKSKFFLIIIILRYPAHIQLPRGSEPSLSQKFNIVLSHYPQRVELGRLFSILVWIFVRNVFVLLVKNRRMMCDLTPSHMARRSFVRIECVLEGRGEDVRSNTRRTN
mmetsp:Transcript_11943/g.25459  ORF Transcript_11943/g.25459 Transcript_11943/m.25459 type:complete len:228 (-) Transcript_11943:419-1102(-)